MTAISPIGSSCVAVVQVASAIVQLLLVVGISFVVLSAITSFLRFNLLTAGPKEVVSTDRLPQDVYHLQLIQRLSTAHRDPSPFAVMRLLIRGLRSAGEQTDEAARKGLLDSVHEMARTAVRSTDVVCTLEDDTVALIVDTPRADLEPVAKRVLTSISSSTGRTLSGLTGRLSVNLGMATCPENGDRAVVLEEQVMTALKQAEASGANQAVLMPSEVSDAEASPIEEELPQQQSLIDPLTGVLRSEKLPRAMQKFIAQYRKDRQPMSVLFLDVDYLRRYNEHYGDGAGDMLLKGVGDLLQQSLREEDLIARLGGEEFVVLMGCDVDGALTAAQRVANEIRRRSFKFEQTTLKITASVGVAGCPVHGTSPRDLLDAARTAVRTAKTKGRGVSMIYDESMRTQRGETLPTDVF